MDGNALILTTLNISMNAVNPAGFSIHEVISVTSDLPGIAQVVAEDRITTGLAAGVTHFHLTRFTRH